MNKQITIDFYDYYLPDYYGGHHKPVLAVSVDGNTTRKELHDGLLSELAMGVIDYQIDENQLDCDAIRQAIKKCIYWNAECTHEDIIFPDLDKSVYAFFIVEWEELDND